MAEPGGQEPSRSARSSDPNLPDFILDLDPSALWECLTRDTSLAVMVFDAGGDPVYRNAHARHRGLADALDPACDRAQPVAHELSDCVRAVAGSRRPIVFEGMLQGIHFLVVLRPLLVRNSIYIVALFRSVTDLLKPTSASTGEKKLVRARRRDLGCLTVLTRRELEILGHIGDGLTSQEIARKLHRSAKTIEWHRAQIGGKLGVKSRVELARIAIAAGLCTKLDADTLTNAHAADSFDPKDDGFADSAPSKRRSDPDADQDHTGDLAPSPNP